MRNLLDPEVVSCYFDEGFMPRLAAMCLRWPDDEAVTKSRLWHFPENVRLISPWPERLGVSVRRTGSDAYDVNLLWNHVSLRWCGLVRSQLLQGSLNTVLASVGTDLGNLLDQPVVSQPELLRRAG